MRVYVYPEAEGKHVILVVPSPAKRQAPTLLSAGSKDGVLQGLRDHLGVVSPEPAQATIEG